MADQILTQQQLLDLLNPNGNIYPLDRVQLLRDLVLFAGQGGGGRSSTGAPFSGISVTDAAYGGIDDGLDGYFTITSTAGQQNLTILTVTGTVTVANTGTNGNAVVTFGDTLAPGQGPVAEWVGKPIAITGIGAAGGTLQSSVVTFYYDFNNSNLPTLELADAASTTGATSQSVACPCFTNAYVNKALWISNAGTTAGGSGSLISSLPFATTIASVTTPFTAVLVANVPTTFAAKPGSYIVWGTDNSAAIIAAGLAAIAAGRLSLFFPGGTKASSTKLFFAPNFMSNKTGSLTATDITAMRAQAALFWWSYDARTFITNVSATSPSSFYDWSNRKQAIPWTADAPPAPMRTLFGPSSFPRASRVNTIVVCVTGDSWGLNDSAGTGGGAPWGPVIREIERQNPGKAVHVVLRGIGGATWRKLASTANLATNVTLPWITGGQPWSFYLQTATVDGLGSVTPDIILIVMTGNNDGETIHLNDIETVLNKIATFPTKNGLPPDVIGITGIIKDGEGNVGQLEGSSMQSEYAIALQRSALSVLNVPLAADIFARESYTVVGWSPTRLSLKVVPQLAQSAAILPSAPYSLQHKCRDFFVALKLVGTGGADFWGRALQVHVSLSAKGDNRLIIGLDGSNNLTVQANAWGMTVATTATLANGAAALTTVAPGSTAITSSVIPVTTSPSWQLPQGGPTYTFGQCVLAPGAYVDGGDYRSYIVGLTNATNAFVCDGNVGGNAVTSIFMGGQMFVPGDATALVDCIITNGANVLTTKITGYTNKTSVALRDNWGFTSLAATAVSMFVGRITMGPTYDTAVLAGTDAGANPILTIKKVGNHVRVGYVLGADAATNTTDIRLLLQNHEWIVWEGEVECFGAPYIPLVWISNPTPSASVFAQAIYLWTGERELFRPSLISREVTGIGDSPLFNYPLGGDSSHPTHRFISRVIDPVVETQDFSTGTNYLATWATNTPITAFSYTIPANSAFTELTPAGTLATGTVTLPSVFPQGGRLEIFSTQIVTALTIVAPSGFALVGTAVTTIAANGTLAYRLTGTNWVRVQ